MLFLALCIVAIVAGVLIFPEHAPPRSQEEPLCR